MIPQDEVNGYRAKAMSEDVAPSVNIVTPPPTSSTEAEQFVRNSAKQIGLHGESLNELCEKMHREFVINIEQFRHIDSSQWRDLAAPIGLVATMRHQLSIINSSSKKNNDALSSTVCKNEVLSPIDIDSVDGCRDDAEADEFQRRNKQTNDRKNDDITESTSTLSSTSSTQPPATPTKQRQKSFMSDSDDSSSSSSSSSFLKFVKRREEQKNVRACNAKEGKMKETKFGAAILNNLFLLRMWSLFKVWRFIDFFMPFDHQKDFKLAMLHTMSNHDLKHAVLSISELWFIFNTIFLGSCIELWGGFPEFEADEGFGMYSLAYNFVIYLTTITCAIGVAIFSVVFVVTSTVHKSNMKRYFLLVMPALQFGEVLLMASWYGLFSLCLMYFHARNAATIMYNGLCDIDNYMLTAVAGLIFAMLYGYLGYNINLIGRLTFHCGLMGENTEEEDIISGEKSMRYSTAEVEEQEVRRTLLSKIVINSKRMNDSYRTKSFLIREDHSRTSYTSDNTTTRSQFKRQKSLLVGGMAQQSV